ncbi:MAG: NAD(P)H-hydrate dehydratase [Acidobacteriota bacterium]
MKLLRADQMREVDRLTSECFGIPTLLLMEQAAARTVEAVEKKFGSLSGRRAVILCGKGNNGGDGAAIARQLWMRGCRVDLLLLGRVDDAQGDARINFDIVRALSQGDHLRFVEIENSEQLKTAIIGSPDFVFDAIFGTGLTRPASGIFEEAINLINLLGQKTPVIAVDVPSGVSSDSFHLIGPAVQAHLTVTFTAPKLANALPPASDLSGELVIVSIGSPPELILSSGSMLSLVEREMIARWLDQSRRSPHANKGDAGKVLILAGSRGKTGAASLAGEAALRAGAGLVTIATPQSSLPVVASLSIAECMTEPLEETSSGSVSSAATLRAIELAGERDVTAIGPGLGSIDEMTRSFTREFIASRPRPTVVDADALNSLAPWDSSIKGRQELSLILTPHPGEMARLMGKTTEEVLRDRVEIARHFATNHNLILVLKGSRSLVAAPTGEVYINPTGNAGMATAGAGDVLTGVIAGLMAQKTDDPLGATIAAVYLHGLAGDIAASRAGVRAMIASDISRCLGDAFTQVGGERERLDR